jgi:hypothetical protein
LLAGLHVVFSWRIIGALISLVALVYILTGLLARLIGAFVAAGVRHINSPRRVNACYARRIDGLLEWERSCLDLRGEKCVIFVMFDCSEFSST